jgi:hypothetical protein
MKVQQSLCGAFVTAAIITRSFQFNSVYAEQTPDELPASAEGTVCMADEQCVAKQRAATLEDLNRWEHLGKYSNVDTFVQQFEDSDLLAVRGTAVAGMHISTLLVPFFNATANPYWCVLHGTIKA